MSNLAKKIGKTFKKVGRAFKRVLPALLGIGAIVFTAGAAMGLPAMAGGWGGAVTKGLSAMGISTNGAVGSALAGAVTQAGTGAAISGTLNAATGGSFSEGAATGAVAGGLLGGFTGALNPAAANTVAKAAQVPAATAPAIATAAPVAASAAPAATGMGGFGKFLSSPVVGQTLAGVGQGLMTGLGEKARMEEEERYYNRINDSYDLPADDYALSLAMPKKRKRVLFNAETGLIESV